MITYPYPQYINQPIQQQIPPNYVQPVVSPNQYVYLIYIYMHNLINRSTEEYARRRADMTLVVKLIQYMKQTGEPCTYEDLRYLFL